MPGGWFLWSIFFIINFQKEKANTLTLLIILIVKSLQIAQICYYDPQFARINMQSPQSATTHRRLTLVWVKSSKCGLSTFAFCFWKMNFYRLKKGLLTQSNRKYIFWWPLFWIGQKFTAPTLNYRFRFFFEKFEFKSLNYSQIVCLLPK